MTEQQMLRSDATDSSQTEELWRNEIQARVARYKTRRGRRIEGTYSMRFPFGATEEETPQLTTTAPPEVEPATEIFPDVESEESVQFLPDNEIASPEPSSPQASAIEAPLSSVVDAETPYVEVAAIAEPIETPAIEAESLAVDRDFLLEPDPEPLPPPQPRPAMKRKIIAFPRQASNQEVAPRLADPVLPEQPRILDVPEELEPFPTTPLLEGLQLPAAPTNAALSPDHIDLPVQPVTLSRRMLAGLVDCAVVLGASAVFGGIAYKLLPKLQPSKPLILGAAMIPALLWAVYEYLLLMYAGKTLGMQVTKTRLCAFKGGAPGWRHRRSRVIGLYFSAASLMMGLLWSLVDVDALCWHDRISHTYLTKVE